MDCAQCAGACCEEVHLSAEFVFRPGHDDVAEWLRQHGEPSVDGLRWELRCIKLEPGGRCSIYEDRPQLCRDYEPGGAPCLDVVRRRRTHEQYLQIRDDTDPETIHE